MFYLKIFFFIRKMSESLIFAHFLFFCERCEWIAHFSQKKMKEVNESLISHIKNERPCAIRSGRSEEMSNVRELLISLTKKEWMSESPIFLSESLVRSFLDKKQKIRSEMKWANSQPWVEDEEESLQGITPVVT